MMTQFLKPLFYFSALVGIITLIISVALPDKYISPTLPFQLVLFISVTILSFYYLQKSVSQKFIKFVNTFLLSIVLKLLFYFLIMIVYALLFRNDAVPFLFSFFILYLCFTIFESVSIIKFSKKRGNDES